MDVLACRSCGRRYAFRGDGALGGQRCTSCNGELQVVSRDVSRMSLLGRRRSQRLRLIARPEPMRSAHPVFIAPPNRADTAEYEVAHVVHSASDIDAEIAALARLAREAERP